VLRIDLIRKVIGAVVEVGESATQVAMSPDGAEVFVMDRDGVAVICTSTGAMLDRIAVGERRSCMAVSPATGWHYVADYAGVLTGLPVLHAVDTNVVAERQWAAV
jgi:DNA-binding beta-propeller fold protein YncE